MSERLDEQAFLSDEDEAFVGRLVEHYTPPPQSPARRAALDVELRNRVTARREPILTRPLFASVMVGLAIALALVLAAFEFEWPGGNRSSVVVADESSAEAWEGSLFDPESFYDVGAESDLDELPDDYAAIAGIFLDG